ncbi:hypothetical protein GE115_06025 [Agromyces sp. CFH 90414]|uniref:histidine kinase n=1 Tax=Agromyces agglutinans TaxID=2662258 RepID=A0A6I2F4A7_9MICO|nr:ATP-binding protein [Agromyces agglutinans]MRG59432.1 hypothetical protein [Agromyces agglutinans]
MPPELDGIVYRVVQESLTNIVRHSDATHVRIAVRVEGRCVSVDVVDDGRPGREPDVVDGPAPSAGYGLAGMAERVHALGGTFRAGRTGSGFAVGATLPLGSAVPT